MEKRVLIDTWQKVTRDDFLKFGTMPGDSIDTVIGKLLIPDMAFEGFAVTQSGPAQITVGTGHLFYLGAAYVNDSTGGTTIDLLSMLPAATQKVVTVSVWGSEIDARLEARTFLTDADTRATVARETATEHWRWANVSAVAGLEGPAPTPPAVAANVCPVAYVTIGTTGIVSIQRADAFLAPTLREEDNRLNALDIWKIAIGTLIDTLRSDLLALAARIYGLAPYSLVRQVAHDVAWLKDLSRLPEQFVSYGVDHFLDNSESDLTNVDWLAQIEEGVRFPPAAGFDAQLGLLNIFDPLVINTNNQILPVWVPNPRITNLGTDAEVSISQYQYQTVDMVQKFITRTRVRYGTPFTVCTNQAFWQQGTVDWQNWTFNYGGEVFNIMGTFAYEAYTDTSTGLAQADANISGVPNPAGYLGSMIRLEQVWYDTVQEPYWDRVVNNFAISGSVIAQSFTNAQEGWLCQLDLYFSKVGASGNVSVHVCELTNGSPDPTKVLATATILVADMKISPAGDTARVPTHVTLQPTYLQKARYGIILITAGNHYVWTLSNTNNIAGTLFYSTDGNWFQGDLTKDLCFQAFFCQFANNSSSVQLQALTLSGGIAAIDVLAQSYVPPGCRLFYEIQKNGVWYALDKVDGGPSAVLVGLPPLLPFRATFIGTADVQPMLGVASNSRVTTWRPRSDFKHVSIILNRPSAPTVHADYRVEAWRGSPHHTFTANLRFGAGYLTHRVPDITSEEPAPDEPVNTIIRHYTWTGMGALTSYQLECEGTTDNVLTTYHVAERFDITTNP